MVAGPLYIVVVVLQMLSRDGFDIGGCGPTARRRRHPASMLSNGDQGWIQIVNFATSGRCSWCVRSGCAESSASAANPGGTWEPRLISVLGAGMLGAAAFLHRLRGGLATRHPEGHTHHDELARNGVPPGRRHRLPHAHRRMLRLRPAVRRSRPARNL
ncbi:DUF998 domain-containing protein [Micromonospora polyrhachis]|uniref:DUF998 domain-containing protein n=1 Tax=Micromonospora polyrhachis TaxID=1282883 RepID=UPI0035E401EF